MADHRSFFKELRRTTGMFVLHADYHSVSAFIGGYDTALQGGALYGFREWLVVKADKGNNLCWDGLVLCLAFPDADDPFELDGSSETHRLALDTLFDLIDEFLTVREDRECGVRRIYVEYEKWLRRQSWYGPDSPGYLE